MLIDLTCRTLSHILVHMSSEQISAAAERIAKRAPFYLRRRAMRHVRAMADEIIERNSQYVAVARCPTKCVCRYYGPTVKRG